MRRIVARGQRVLREELTDCFKEGFLAGGASRKAEKFCLWSSGLKVTDTISKRVSKERYRRSWSRVSNHLDLADMTFRAGKFSNHGYIVRL